MPSQSELDAADEGKRLKADELLPRVYNELRQLAARHLANEKSGHTLQPTALVHEAYMRLAEAGTCWEGSRHFYRAAAEAMRRILVDSARRRRSNKRGGGQGRLAMDPDELSGPASEQKIVDLHEALTALAAKEPDIAELVSLRYFAGLTLKDAAELIGFAPRTADAYWAYARSWLKDYIETGENGPLKQDLKTTC